VGPGRAIFAVACRAWWLFLQVTVGYAKRRESRDQGGDLTFERSKSNGDGK